jgi:hypothetical protein
VSLGKIEPYEKPPNITGIFEFALEKLNIMNTRKNFVNNLINDILNLLVLI